MKSLWVLPFSVLLSTSFVTPGRAQLLPRPSVPSTIAPLSFDDIFAGLDAPLSYQIKDLKGEWRLVTIKGRPDLDNGSIAPVTSREMALTSERLRAAIGAGEGQYVTQGQTVAAGGELFLVTYKMKFDESEMQNSLEVAARRANRPLPLPPHELANSIENYVRERPLELRLLNVKMLGEISEIRAFDATAQSKALRDLINSLATEANAASGSGIVEDAATAATPTPVAPTTGNGGVSSGNSSTPLAPAAPTGMLSPTSKPPVSKPATNSTVIKPLPPATIKPASTSGLQERNAASQKNLHLIGLALIAYAQDHNGTLPPAQTPGIARKVLTFYAGSDKIWARPDNGQAYLPNPKMSGRKTGHISNLDEWVAFYEANPAADGTRGVVFLDGSVARITLADWPRVKKASKLP